MAEMWVEPAEQRLREIAQEKDIEIQTLKDRVRELETTVFKLETQLSDRPVATVHKLVPAIAV